jgi:ferritin
MNKQQFLDLGLTEELATKAAEASTTELSTYVPKHRFDEVNGENKTLKATVSENAEQLETLKKSAGDNETLTQQINDLQADNKKKADEYQSTLEDLKITNAIKLAINGNVHDNDLVAGMVDKTKLLMSDDGKITGLDEQLKALKENKAFLFKQEGNKAGFVPKVGGGGQGGEGRDDKPSSLADAVKARFSAANQQ